jgi:hypothetical protein
MDVGLVAASDKNKGCKSNTHDYVSKPPVGGSLVKQKCQKETENVSCC